MSSDHQPPPAPSAATESTPLLPTTSPQPTNQPTDQPTFLSKWFHPQPLSGLSVLICLLLALLCWLLGALAESYTGHRNYYIPWWIREVSVAIAQLSLYTAIFSLLNYTRLRRSALELPWPLTIPIDFLIILFSIGTSSWFLMIAATRDEAPETCRWVEDKEECYAAIAAAKGLVVAALVVLLVLAAVHACLFGRRVFKTPTMTSPTMMATTGGGGVGLRDGWFVGFGRGPLAVRNVGEREGVREGESV